MEPKTISVVEKLKKSQALKIVFEYFDQSD